MRARPCGVEATTEGGRLSRSVDGRSHSSNRQDQAFLGPGSASSCGAAHPPKATNGSNANVKARPRDAGFRPALPDAGILAHFERVRPGLDNVHRLRKLGLVAVDDGEKAGPVLAGSLAAVGARVLVTQEVACLAGFVHVFSSLGRRL